MKIDSIQWGEISVNGKLFKDAILWPEGCKEWDWNDTGTKHSPGIKEEDVKRLHEMGLDKIVLSRGYHLVLQTTPEAIQYLLDNEIEHWILETSEAVKKYNELVEIGEKVGALIHSTC